MVSQAAPTEYLVPDPPLTMIFNQWSGSTGKDSARERILELLRDSGRVFSEVEIQREETFQEHCRQAVARAKEQGGIVVAAGGDGTVNTAAQFCYQYQVPLGIIPLGTFNYFARELSIPLDPEAALQTVLQGQQGHVAAGFIADRIFLINVSFGLYTSIIRKREEDTSRFGRNRMVAALSGLQCLLRPHQLLSVRIGEGETMIRRMTAMVFVGNNTAQLSMLNLDVAECTRQDKLAIIVTKPMSRCQTARLVLWGALRNLKGEEMLEQFCAESFEVDLWRPSIEVVIDGEIERFETPLRFRVERGALAVVVPNQAPPS